MKGFKVGLLLVTLIAGSLALPLEENEGPSKELFFHTNPERIVGGTVAPTGSSPHSAALTQGSRLRLYFCGGSILTQRTVLTAAHCIAHVFSSGSLSDSLRITVGTNRWNTGGQAISVSHNVSHPHYESNLIKNDLGLLITASDIIFDARTSPIALATEWISGGVPSVIAGWGLTRNDLPGASTSQTLQMITLNTIDGDRCVRDVPVAAAAANLRAPPVEPHIELCTFHSVGHGPCNGDSGCALVRQGKGQQIGIMSWGIPCVRGGPDMFVRISAFNDWIRANTV